MGLRKYNEKRDFTKTSEPEGEVASGTGPLRFVIQKHDATRLHYDFRLEVDGVLKSWAVPKGPSLDPGDKRLAVEVEDHPLSYGGFEGNIPAGEYGGGPVLLWDDGTWEPDGDAATALAKGRLTFTLHGHKLAGRFHLVRLRGDDKKPQWLLMKSKDNHARDGVGVDQLPEASVKSGKSLADIKAGQSDRGSTTPPPDRGVFARAHVDDVAVSGVGGAGGAGDTVAGVHITHPERVLYEVGGRPVRKLDIARYVEAVAPLMLPHVRGRPLAVVRCPEGSAGPCFFQKHVMRGMPAGIHSLPVDEEKGKAETLTVHDVSGLVGLVQMGALEFHCWGSAPDEPERPDRIVIDLDPHEGLSFARVVDAARDVRERLARDGLRSWVKTTGGKGLHVVAPLTGSASWDEVKKYTHGLAVDMERDHPDCYTANLKKTARVGRVFIDYLRNGRGATAIAPYSMRNNAGATVSVPVAWEEIDEIRGDQWSVLTLHERIAKGPDPWRPYFATHQPVPSTSRTTSRAHAQP